MILISHLDYRIPRVLSHTNHERKTKIGPVPKDGDNQDPNDYHVRNKHLLTIVPTASLVD